MYNKFNYNSSCEQSSGAFWLNAYSEHSFYNFSEFQLMYFLFFCLILPSLLSPNTVDRNRKEETKAEKITYQRNGQI